MATFAEIEDLRDWMIDNCGEFLARFDVLNSEEPEVVIAHIKKSAENMHTCGLETTKWLNELLIQKKRVE